MNLTKEQLFVMLKKAYMRGVYEHIEQRYRKPKNEVKVYPKVDIPNYLVEDLIP